MTELSLVIGGRKNEEYKSEKSSKAKKTERGYYAGVGGSKVKLGILSEKWRPPGSKQLASALHCT